MKIRKIASVSLIAISTAFASIAANAADLTIINNTDFDNSCIINKSHGGFCSSNIPGGVTKAHSTNVVSSTTVKMACILDSSNCTADVYMNNNCVGSSIASIVFDTKTGIKSVTMNTKEYTLTASGFKIQLDPVSK